MKLKKILELLNVNDRTYFINDEANIHILSSSLAAQQKTMFYNDLKHCKRMNPSDAKMKFTPKDIYNRLGAHLMMPQL